MTMIKNFFSSFMKSLSSSPSSSPSSSSSSGSQKKNFLSFFFFKGYFILFLLTILFLCGGFYQGSLFSLQDVFPWIQEPWKGSWPQGSLMVFQQPFLLMMLYFFLGTFTLGALIFFASLEEVVMALTFILFFVSYLPLNLLFLSLYGLLIIAPLLFFSLGKKIYQQSTKDHPLSKKDHKKSGKNSEIFWIFFYALFFSSVMFLSLSWNSLTDTLKFLQSCFWLPGVLGLFLGSFFLVIMMFSLDKTQEKIHYREHLPSFYYWFLAGCQIVGLFAFQEFIDFFTNIFLIGCLPFVGNTMAYLWVKTKKMPSLSSRLKIVGGIIMTFLGFPLILFFLYSLFQPWIPPLKEEMKKKKES